MGVVGRQLYFASLSVWFRFGLNLRRLGKNERKKLEAQLLAAFCRANTDDFDVSSTPQTPFCLGGTVPLRPGGAASHASYAHKKNNKKNAKIFGKQKRKQQSLRLNCWLL